MMPEHHEYLIIGSGPAGVQLGYYLNRSRRDYLILERSARPGAFFENYPRHRSLLSINKVHTGSEDPEFNLRHDWNSLLSEQYRPLFKEHSAEYFPPADALLEYLQHFVDAHDVRTRLNVTARRITRDGDLFRVECGDREVYTCNYLVVATGVSQPYVPEIPGIALAEGYEDVSVDPDDFIDQRVLVIGKGNSGFETANSLVGTAALIHLASPHSIEMAWRTHFVGDLRAINNTFLDSYQLKSQNAVLDAEIRSLRRLPDGRIGVTFGYRQAPGEVEELAYDRVIRCTGFRFDDSIFDERCKPQLAINDRLPRLTCEWESTNQPNMYFIGVLMQEQGYKASTSSFIHGFRYNIRTLSHILASKNHDEPLPADRAQRDPAALATKILSRANRSSDLWQQHSFLADALVLGYRKSVEYWCGLPVRYIHEKIVSKGLHCLVINLEFGPKCECDPFKANRIRGDEVERASESRFLHPTIREYADGVQVSEHHAIENLEARWQDAVHVEPLTRYLADRVPPGRSRRAVAKA